MSQSRQTENTLQDAKHWLAKLMLRIAAANAKPDAAPSVFGNEAGVCFGLSVMATQASLLGEMEAFERRLLALQELYLLGKEQDLTLDMLAFLNGVEVFHQPYLHPELFIDSMSMTQSIEQILPLLMSKKLEKQGGMRSAAAFTGIYRAGEIKEYLTSLKAAAISSEATQPIALMIRSDHHFISVSYDPRHKIWYLVDGEPGSVQRFHSATELAKAMWETFGKETYTALSTQVYLTEKQLAAGNSIVSHWQQSDAWKKLHQTSPSNLKRKEANGCNWLMLATLENDQQSLQALINAGANVNAERCDGVTALHLAAIQGNTAAMALLLKAGAAQGAVTNGGESALFLAAKYGQTGCVELLLKAGANPNLVRAHDGATPLHMAAYFNNVAAAKLLLQHNADMNIRRTNDNTTPLELAVAEGQQTMIDLLNASNAPAPSASAKPAKKKWYNFGLFKSQPRAQATAPRQQAVGVVQQSVLTH